MSRGIKGIKGMIGKWMIVLAAAFSVLFVGATFSGCDNGNPSNAPAPTNPPD